MNIQLQDANFRVSHPVDTGICTAMAPDGDITTATIDRLSDTGFFGSEIPEVVAVEKDTLEDEHFEVVGFDNGQRLITVSRVTPEE